MIKVVCKAGGLLLIEPHENLLALYLERASNGIFETRPDVPLEIIVAKFGAKPFVLRKGLNIAQKSHLLLGIQELPYNKPLVASTLNVSEDFLPDSIR